MKGLNRLYRGMIAAEIGTTERFINDHRLAEFANRATALSERLSVLLENGGWTNTSKELFLSAVAAAASRSHFLSDDRLNQLAEDCKRIASRKGHIFNDK